jgi:hypothetical protein
LPTAAAFVGVDLRGSWHHGAKIDIPQAPLLCHQVQPDARRQNAWSESSVSLFFFVFFWYFLARRVESYTVVVVLHRLKRLSCPYGKLVTTRVCGFAVVM